MPEGGYSPEELGKLAEFNAKLTDSKASRPLSTKEVALKDVQDEVNKAATDLLIKLLDYEKALPASEVYQTEKDHGKGENAFVTQETYFCLPEALPDGRMVVAHIEGVQKGVSLGKHEVHRNEIAEKVVSQSPRQPWGRRFLRLLSKSSTPEPQGQLPTPMVVLPDRFTPTQIRLVKVDKELTDTNLRQRNVGKWVQNHKVDYPTGRTIMRSDTYKVYSTEDVPVDNWVLSFGKMTDPTATPTHFSINEAKKRPEIREKTELDLTTGHVQILPDLYSGKFSYILEGNNLVQSEEPRYMSSSDIINELYRPGEADEKTLKDLHRILENNSPAKKELPKTIPYRGFAQNMLVGLNQVTAQAGLK